MRSAGEDTLIGAIAIEPDQPGDLCPGCDSNEEHCDGSELGCVCTCALPEDWADRIAAGTPAAAIHGQRTLEGVVITTPEPAHTAEWLAGKMAVMETETQAFIADLEAQAEEWRREHLAPVS
jgi:hypothetical protein